MAYFSPMPGTKATRAAGGHDPIAAEGVARAEAKHWRDLATQREAALRTLTRRPLVRIAVGIDRRTAPLGRRLGAWRATARGTADRTALAIAALRARPARSRRRAILARVAAYLEPVPTGPTVSVITLAPSVVELWRDPTETPAQVLLAEATAVTGHPGPGRTRAAALAQAASAATGEVLCFVPDEVDAPAPGWLARLADAIGPDAVAATPTLVHPERRGRGATEQDLLVRAEGFDVELDAAGAPIVVARSAGRDPDVTRAMSEVDAAPLRCLAVSRVAYLAAGGLRPAEVDDDVAAVDLCTRLRESGGRIRHVPQALVYDDRPVGSRRALRRPIDPSSPSWRSLVERHGASLARAAQGGGGVERPRWVISTSVPSARVAARWGDWHLAEALARSLRGRGVDARVQTRDRVDALAARSCDLHLVLHGLAPVRRTPGQRHVLWVISHPETLEAAECDAADLVLVASPRFAAHLRSCTSTPVEVLLQATDPDRFRPQPPSPEHHHEVTIVAKTRDVLRPVVADAVAAGFRPAIYGSGWRDLVDPSLVVADHVDNASLAAVYSSAGVVLNDHWDTMRAWGFVSNRIFDVLACGTPVISDDLDEIHDLFGDAVPTYRTSDELGDLVRRSLDDPAGARARAAAGRAIVLAHHTFDQRATELMEILDRHGLRDDQTRMEGAHD